MGLIHANGIDLNCQTIGQGPLLAMCHGLVFGSLATWYFSSAARLSKRFEVLLYDQRGHGNSQLSASGYDVDTMTDDLAAVVDRYRQPDASGPISLVGHSYGALIALNYALRHPRRVSRLALIDAPLPASRFVSPSMVGVSTKDALETAYAESIKQKKTGGSRSAKRMRERLDYLFLESTLRNDVANAQDISDEMLRNLPMPVLCLYGRQSDCLEVGERLAQVIPHAMLELLDCGHYIPVEAPEEMTKRLDQFL